MHMAKVGCGKHWGLAVVCSGRRAGPASGTSPTARGTLPPLPQAAEGRNAAVDDPVDSALHAALKPEPCARAAAPLLPAGRRALLGGPGARLVARATACMVHPG